MCRSPHFPYSRWGFDAQLVSVQARSPNREISTGKSRLVECVVMKLF
jgi:hypothetical protein